MSQYKKLILISVLLFGSVLKAQTHTISVVGVSEKVMEANMITLNVEIWSKAQTAKQAQVLSASEYQKVKKVFESFKIKKEDISTDSYSLNPEYVYDNKTQQNKMSGFRVVQNVTVTLRKIDDAGTFLDSISTASKGNDVGININNIQWDSDNRAQFELSGLSEAVMSAKKKADEIAKAAGVKIKGVFKISNNVTNTPPMFSGRAMFSKMAAAESAPTEITSGGIKVRVEVIAEYEL